MPLFSKKHKGIIIEIKGEQHLYNFETWYTTDTFQGQHFKRIKYITVHTESGQFNLSLGEITSNQHECVNELFPLTGDLLVDTLRTVYKLQNFRPFQKEVIQSVMNRKHTLAVMPTGSEKTLCFTMPAILSTGCVTFDIFPLNS